MCINTYLTVMSTTPPFIPSNKDSFFCKVLLSFSNKADQTDDWHSLLGDQWTLPPLPSSLFAYQVPSCINSHCCSQYLRNHMAILHSLLWQQHSANLLFLSYFDFTIQITNQKKGDSRAEHVEYVCIKSRPFSAQKSSETRLFNTEVEGLSHCEMPSKPFFS